MKVTTEARTRNHTGEIITHSSIAPQMICGLIHVRLKSVLDQGKYRT